MTLDDKTRTELEAAVYRRLVEHLRARTDVQNIDLMNLAGFCRNCLSNWMKDAADEKGLAIEEIKKFMEQVNKAVLAGIRGGIVYSTAGNAIPLGGPGEFVKNEGGVNIGTVNLRGVWDFADPAAKREIVRQLQEALAQFEREVA